MKVQRLGIGQFLVRLDSGEEIIETLTEFARKEGLRTGSVHGIGACRQIEVGYADIKAKEYVRQPLKGDHEILSLTGNITIKDGGPFLHLHGVFSDTDFALRGGHFFGGVITATGEFFIEQKGNAEISRRFAEHTGIWEMNIP